MDIKNLSIIRQTFANAVFTHKVQEIAAENQSKKALMVKIWSIVLVSVVLIFMFLQAYNPETIIFTYIGIGLGLGEFIFLIVQLYFPFAERVAEHKNSALKYMGLRDRYRNLIADVMNDKISDEEIKARRDSLQGEYQIISETAPQTNSEEYEAAQERLNKRGTVKGEEFTWSDEEIDRFLPEKLRLKK